MDVFFFACLNMPAFPIDFSVLHFGWLPPTPTASSIFQLTFQLARFGQGSCHWTLLPWFCCISFFQRLCTRNSVALVGFLSWKKTSGAVAVSSLADGGMNDVPCAGGWGRVPIRWGSKQLIRWGLEELNCEAKNIAAPINSASFWSCNPSFPNSGRWTMSTVWWESYELDSPYAQVASNKISNSWDFQEGKGRGEKEGRSDITSRRMDFGADCWWFGFNFRKFHCSKILLASEDWDMLQLR